MILDVCAENLPRIKYTGFAAAARAFSELMGVPDQRLYSHFLSKLDRYFTSALLDSCTICSATCRLVSHPKQKSCSLYWVQVSPYPRLHAALRNPHKWDTGSDNISCNDLCLFLCGTLFYISSSCTVRTCCRNTINFLNQHMLVWSVHLLSAFVDRFVHPSIYLRIDLNSIHPIISLI